MASTTRRRRRASRTGDEAKPQPRGLAGNSPRPPQVDPTVESTVRLRESPPTQTRPFLDALQTFRTNELILMMGFLLQQVSPRKRLPVLAGLKRLVADADRVPATEHFDWVREHLQKMKLPTRRGRHPRATKGEPWLATAYEMLMQVHAEAKGDPRVIKQRLDAYRTKIETAYHYFEMITAPNPLPVGPALPFDRLATCNLDKHANQNKPTHHSAFALDVLAEITGQDDQDHVGSQVARIRERRLADLNAVLSSRGKPPVPSRRRGRQRPDTRDPGDRLFLADLQSKLSAIIRRSAQ